MLNPLVALIQSQSPMFSTVKRRSEMARAAYSLAGACLGVRRGPPEQPIPIDNTPIIKQRIAALPGSLAIGESIYS